MGSWVNALSPWPAPPGVTGLIKVESRNIVHEDGIMVSFSKSIAVVASLTTIAVGAVAAVRYFDGMDGQIRDQRLLIEKLQKDLKGHENGAQSPQSQFPAAQPPATPSLTTPPSESLQGPPPLPPVSVTDEAKPSAAAQ